MDITDASPSLHFVSEGNFMRGFLFIRKIARLAQIHDLLAGSIGSCLTIFSGHLNAIAVLTYLTLTACRLQTRTQRLILESCRLEVGLTFRRKL